MKKINPQKANICITGITLGLILFISFPALAEERAIEELFDNSMLAVASYVDFEAGDGSDDNMEIKLKNDDDWQGDPKKIQIFTDRFSLLHHLGDTNTSSFSATIFQKKEGGQITFASKGSAEWIGDFIIADGGGIFLSGVPQRQVVDLYNYVQQLKTPENGQYRYVKFSVFQGFGLDFGYKNDGLGKTWFTGKTVNAAGHSLGGNLTHAFGRTFSQSAKDGYTYNGAGVAGSFAWALEKMSDALENLVPVNTLTESEFYSQLDASTSYNNFNTVSNVYGKQGIKLTTNDTTFNQPGKRISVNTEFGEIPILADLQSHSSLLLMDSLAVAWNFNHIDPSFTLANHSAIMDAAGTDESQDLETLTKGLHKVIIGSENTNMWEGIYDISNKTDAGGSIKVLAGKSPSFILDHYNQSEASKKGVIYAALEGLPFSYDNINGAAYDEIDPVDFSSQAVYDLVGMLATDLHYNVNDSSFNPDCV